jgi:hypothetical protein
VIRVSPKPTGCGRVSTTSRRLGLALLSGTHLGESAGLLTGGENI